MMTAIRLTCLATICLPCFVVCLVADLAGTRCHACERVVHFVVNGN